MAVPSINLSSDQTAEQCPFIGFLAWNETYLTKDVLTGLIALISINTITAILAVLLNSLIILAVVRNPQMRSNYKILLACLAGNDLLTGVLVQPLRIAQEAKHVLGAAPYCGADMASLIAALVSCWTSSTHVAIVTLDRYVAIKFPLQYRSVITKRRLIRVVLIAWAVPLTCAIVAIGPIATFAGKTMFDLLRLIDILIAFSMLLSVVGTIYMNAAIFAEIRRHRKRLDSHQNELTRQEENTKLKRKNKIAKTVAIIVTVLVLSYIPALTLLIFANIIMELVEKRVLNVLFAAAMTILQLNSFLNPLIYGWRIKEFRDAFFEMLPSCHSQNGNSVEHIEMQSQHPTFHPSISADLPLPTVEQEPLLISFSNLNTVDSVL